MYQALYRKYRPKTFEDVCGQEHIVAVLKEQIRSGRMPHAYMFCGSRGTGKTTFAKILAKVVNCDNLNDGSPCNSCPSCVAINEGRMVDVVEMDAASNNGVDDIRSLCDELQYLPAEGKKRVYIIDEVHMLSGSAFNALLKTLEEPPEHVLFIFATTEIHKIPATILSRCQRFDFKRIKPETIIERLMYVSAKEKIKLRREAASVIARLSDGAMRDALSLLEACTGFDGEIGSQEVSEILGLGDRELILGITEALAAHNAARVMALIGQLYDKQSEIKSSISDIVKLHRDLLVIRCVPSCDGYLDCYDNEIERLKNVAEQLSDAEIYHNIVTLENLLAGYDRISGSKRASCEIAFLKLCDRRLDSSAEALTARVSELERRISQGYTPVNRQETAKSAPAVTDNGTPAVSAEVSKIQAETETDTSDSADTAGSDARFDRLKTALGETNPIFKSFLSEMSFRMNGSECVVSVTGMAKNILSSGQFFVSIESKIKEIIPEAASIRIVSADVKSEAGDDSLAGL